MRVVLAPNAFQGSLDAVAVARAWAEAAAARPIPVEARSVPMSDGGDGFLSALRFHRPHLLEVAARARDPLGRPIAALWGWDPEKGRGYVESAGAVGLRHLAPGERDPLRTTSAGLAGLLRAAAGVGVDEIVVGLGGSATVDGGVGFARALGFRFEDREGREIDVPAALADLARIAPPPAPPLGVGCRVLALADVDAPLHGADGAARAFGPQKGADPAAVERLAAGLEVLAEAWRRDLGAPADLASRAGAGAAGGLGAGLVAFLGAALAPGAAWFAERAGLAKELARADAVLTGEGRFDRQSLRGKATGHVLALAREAGVRGAIVCGSAAADPPDGVLLLDAGALDRPGERLDAADLGRLAGLAFDRWASARDAFAGFGGRE